MNRCIEEVGNRNSLLPVYGDLSDNIPDAGANPPRWRGFPTSPILERIFGTHRGIGTMNMESILKCTANFRDYLLKDLTEPEFAKQYLEVSLAYYEKDGDIDMLAHAIRNVVEAQGGMEKLAIQTNRNLQDLHDVLDAKNPPQLNRLLDILSFYTDTARWV